MIDDFQENLCSFELERAPLVFMDVHDDGVDARWPTRPM